MKLGIVKRTLGIAVVVGGLISSLPALAGDRDLSANTIFFFSSDNWPAARAGFEASDIGAFMHDPEIVVIKERLVDGLMKMIRNSIEGENGGEGEHEAAPEALKVFEDVIGLVKEYVNSIYKDCNGRCGFSLGYSEDDSGVVTPEVLLHFQGGEGFDGLHDKIINAMTTHSQGELTETRFELAGASFKGVSFPVTPSEQVPVKTPEGFFFGRKGSDCYIGFYKKTLEDYIKSSAGGGTAVGGRLGNDPHYQKALAAAGTGSFKSYVNFRPVWALVQKHGGAMNIPGGASVNGIIDAVGLRTFRGFYSAGGSDGNGSRSRSFISLEGRQGLFRLIPETDESISMPKCVPANASSVSVVKLRLDQLLDIVLDIASSVAGDGFKNQVLAGLGSVEEEIGVKVKDLLDALEGTMLFYTPDSGPKAAPPAMPMMGMGAMEFAFGLKVKDVAPFRKLLENVVANPQMGGMVKTEDFLGRKVYTFGVNPDTPPEFASGGPQPAVTIDGDWLIIALTPEILKGALRAADGDEAARLTGNPEYRTVVGPLKAGGIGIAYEDTGKTMSQAVDSIRPFIGFFPMGISGMKENPDLLFLFQASNLPSSSVIKKYFGRVGYTYKVVDGGMFMESWAPSVTKVKEKPKEQGL